MLTSLHLFNYMKNSNIVNFNQPLLSWFFYESLLSWKFNICWFGAQVIPIIIGTENDVINDSPTLMSSQARSSSEHSLRY